LEANPTGLVALQQTLPDSQPGLIHHILTHDANPLANWLSAQN
jgi:hypothetical protein